MRALAGADLGRARLDLAGIQELASGLWRRGSAMGTSGTGDSAAELFAHRSARCGNQLLPARLLAPSC
jgi:hypothetical protein